MTKSDLIDIACHLLYQTDKAYCITDGTKDDKGDLVKIWIPKSQCEWMEADKIMVMPEWLAIDKGLV